MLEKELLASILLQLGETRKGVESVESNVTELREEMRAVGSQMMRRDECHYLHGLPDAEEKAKGRLHRTVSTLAGAAALLAFIGSLLVGFVKVTKYVEQIDNLQKQTQSLIKLKSKQLK